jgi:hypothetical protein
MQRLQPSARVGANRDLLVDGSYRLDVACEVCDAPSKAVRVKHKGSAPSALNTTAENMLRLAVGVTRSCVSHAGTTTNSAVISTRKEFQPEFLLSTSGPTDNTHLTAAERHCQPALQCNVFPRVTEGHGCLLREPQKP